MAVFCWMSFADQKGLIACRADRRFTQVANGSRVAQPGPKPAKSSSREEAAILFAGVAAVGGSCVGALWRRRKSRDYYYQTWKVAIRPCLTLA